MRLGRVEIALARDGVFRLDGGQMYGIVPRALWERVLPADDLNRVPVAGNAFLVTLEDGRRALLECGIGRAWNEKIQKIYSFEGPGLLDSLAALGVEPGDVGLVCLSHLHFDHAGRATYEEKGAWVPAFPNAEYIATRTEWLDAHNVNERTRASYRAECYDPLKSAGQLRLVDATLEEPVELTPGLELLVTGGHTRGHAAYRVTSAGKTALFWGDLLPTRAHTRPAWITGVDLYPYEGCETKKRLMEESIKGGWLALLVHETGEPIGTLERGEKHVEFRAAGE